MISQPLSVTLRSCSVQARARSLGFKMLFIERVNIVVHDPYKPWNAFILNAVGKSETKRRKQGEGRVQLVKPCSRLISDWRNLTVIGKLYLEAIHNRNVITKDQVVTRNSIHATSISAPFVERIARHVPNRPCVLVPYEVKL